MPTSLSKGEWSLLTLASLSLLPLFRRSLSPLSPASLSRLSLSLSLYGVLQDMSLRVVKALIQPRAGNSPPP